MDMFTVRWGIILTLKYSKFTTFRIFRHILKLLDATKMKFTGVTDTDVTVTFMFILFPKSPLGPRYDQKRYILQRH